MAPGIHGHAYDMPAKAAAAATKMNASSNEKQAQLREHTVDMTAGNAAMKTLFGAKIEDTDTWLRAGSRGQLDLADQTGREKIHFFDHERVPERVVHARGAAAHGQFVLHTPLSTDITSAKVLTTSGYTCPMFVRFSTVQGSKGSADTVRDVRGFATRFYTQEGNWDIVGNNVPVFFIQVRLFSPSSSQRRATNMLCRTASNSRTSYMLSSLSHTTRFLKDSQRTIPS
jgi:catalase